MLLRALFAGQRAVRVRSVRGMVKRGLADARIIDGKAISQEILRDVGAQVDTLKEGFGSAGIPTLAVVLVGNRPDSAKYVEHKKKAAKQVGFNSIECLLPEDCSQEELLDRVSELNRRPEIDGILVQLPLPPQCDQEKVLESIDVTKDVDGFHPQNMGRLARMGEDLRHVKQEFVPLETQNCSCTPLGSIVLLEKAGIEISGKHAVVLGRSNIVGLPAALMLLHKNATVTMAHSRTKNLDQLCQEADILIAALGIAEFVPGSWIKSGAAVIDVGINFTKDPSKKSGVRMCGDVNFEQARKVAGAITPVPGGVGPMTVAMLMVNTLNNAKHRLERRNQNRAKLIPGFLCHEKDEDENSKPRTPEQLVRRRSQTVSHKYGTSAAEP